MQIQHNYLSSVFIHAVFETTRLRDCCQELALGIASDKFDDICRFDSERLQKLIADRIKYAEFDRINHVDTYIRKISNSADVSFFEIVSDFPFVLHVGSILVVIDNALRRILSIGTVGIRETQREFTIEEILHARETVSTRTAAHVGIGRLLVLEAETGGNRVGADVPGKVVLDVEDEILDPVVVSKQFSSERGVRNEVTGAVVPVGHDIDMGEIRRIGSPDVID